MKKRFQYIVLCSLFAALLIGGVSATWIFSGQNVDAVHDNRNIIINEWYYEENLPGGGEDAEEDFNDGISHAGLIQDILDDISLYFSNDDSKIMHAIEGAIDYEDNNGSDKDHDGIGSSVKYNGETLRDFAGSRGYENLGFFIYYGPDIEDASEITTIEIYTYYLSDTDGRIGEYIEVYKTIAEYSNGNWILRGGWKGSAPIVHYGNSNTTGKYKNVIDPLLWVKDEENN